MDEKQPQQYRQHFNLSEATKRMLEGNAPEPFTIANVYLPLSRDAKGCIQWAKSFAKQTMQPVMVLPEHLLLSVLRCQGMRQFLTQLLPATEPLLAGLTGEMGYTNYIDQLIRTRVRQTIRQEAVGKSTTTLTLPAMNGRGVFLHPGDLPHAPSEHAVEAICPEAFRGIAPSRFPCAPRYRRALGSQKRDIRPSGGNAPSEEVLRRLSPSCTWHNLLR